MNYKVQYILEVAIQGPDESWPITYITYMANYIVNWNTRDSQEDPGIL